MGKRPSNFTYNYKHIVDYLKKNDIVYHEFDDGQHLRILGDTVMVDVWPSRMAYHIVASEQVSDTGYHNMSFHFKPDELERVLEGKVI